MRLSALLLPLALLAAPARADGPAPVNGLQWDIQLDRTFSDVGALTVRAFLRNVAAGPLRYEAKGDRPPVELVLTPKGGKPVTKALPAGFAVDRSHGALPRIQYAWFLTGDLREAFGKLPPGTYTVRLVHSAAYKTDAPGFQPAPIPSEPLAFEVLKTTLDAARKQCPATPGIAFRAVEKGKGRVGLLTNHGEKPLKLWAYGDQGPGRPLQALVTTEVWNGRAWTGQAGGWCGTGLEEFTIAPGETREIALSPFADGILRFQLSCREGKKDLTVCSEPILVDTWKK